MKFSHLLLLLVVILSAVGCNRRATNAKVPSPPDLPQPTMASAAPQSERTIPRTPAVSPKPPVTNNELAPLAGVEKPLYTELGLASWYGPPYHNRRSANGELYDMNQMTAAHRTLPLNSIVRVTNIKTGSSAVVRITDRGPFIGERMLDLSLAAAKAVDVWGPGTAWVKMDVLATPVPLDSGGKWEVQIGAFDNVEVATQLKEEILRRYHPARIVEFAGPTGEWVRVRVQNDQRELAEEISRSISTPQGGVFLVRLD